jgi:hypothetical protein
MMTDERMDGLIADDPPQLYGEAPLVACGPVGPCPCAGDAPLDPDCECECHREDPLVTLWNLLDAAVENDNLTDLQYERCAAWLGGRS